MLAAMALLFVVFVVGITSGFVRPNDPVAAPLAIPFVVLMLLVLLT